MAATRGRRPLVGVLVGGSGGTYVAPTLRNARGRVFPGVLVAMGGSDASGSLRQRVPFLTQTATATVGTDGTIAQVVPFLTQAAAGTVTLSTARAVYVTYLVLEVPDPANAGTITQTLPFLTQTAAGTVVTGVGTITQIVPFLTQAGTVDVTVPAAARIAQVVPFLTQTATGTVGPAPVMTPLMIWQTVVRPRAWRTKHK